MKVPPGLAEAGLGFDESLVVRGAYQREWRKAIKVLLGLEERPTAVFCANDLMAIEAMQYARVGLRIPEDLAVVGFTTPNCVPAWD